MSRWCISVACLVVALVGVAAAFQTRAIIDRIDPDNKIVEVTVGGSRRTLVPATDLRVFGLDGKELKNGLNARELAPGRAVMIDVQNENGGIVLHAIRLRVPAGGDQVWGDAVNRVQIEQIDVESGTVSLLSSGLDYSGMKSAAFVSSELRVVGQDGELLAAGLKARELVAGTYVSCTLDPGRVITEIRILRPDAVAPLPVGRRGAVTRPPSPGR